MSKKETKTIEEFIEENRESLTNYISNGFNINYLDIDQEEIENWVYNDEDLYLWAYNEGVIL